jgi:hypothetical protein
MAPALKPDAPQEHPVIAWLGILAVALAILLILWARYEVHGTHDLESALAETPAKPSPDADRETARKEVDDAVAAGRWAAGFSP